MQECGTPVALFREQEVDLAGAQRLVIRQQGGEDLLQILSADGKITLTIQVTDRGPVLRFEGLNVIIKAAGELSLKADQLALVGRAGVSVTSGGDVNIQTPGNLHSTARIQNITATRGNVNVRANDDVKLNGERVLVNC